MVNNYEGLFILEAKLTEEKRNALIEKFSKMAGSSVKVDKWGVKKFAYPINYKNEGFYVLMTFAADNTVVEKIVKLMNITDGVVRHMFIKVENKTAKKPAKKQTTKTVEQEIIEKPVAKTLSKPAVTETKPAAEKPAAAKKPAAEKATAIKEEPKKETVKKTK